MIIIYYYYSSHLGDINVLEELFVFQFFNNNILYLTFWTEFQK